MRSMSALFAGAGSTGAENTPSLPAMVVAIDGPAGAGKSTVARAVADALGFTYLDSGAMYRAVALQALRRGKEPAEVAISLDTELMTSPDIRTPEVSEAASKVATLPDVRAALV